MKKCCACGIEKEPQFFYKNVALKDGLSARCKQCHIKKIMCRSGRPLGSKKNPNIITKKKSYKDSFLELRLFKPRREDYENSYLLLKEMGYDISRSIHEQFCEKHGLTPTEPKEFENNISPEELGLT